MATDRQIDQLINAIEGMVTNMRRTSNTSFSRTNPTGRGGSREDDPGVRSAAQRRNEQNIRLRRLEEQALRGSIDSYKEFANNLRKLDPSRDISRILGDVSDAMNQRVNDLERSFESADDAVKFFSSNLGQNLRRLDVQVDIAHRRLAQMADSGEDLTEIQERIIQLESERAELLEQSNEALAENTDTLSDKLATVTAMLSMFGTVLTGIYGDVMKQFQFATQASVFELNKFALLTGTSTDDLARFSAQNRQAVNVLGGTTSAFEQVAANTTDLIRYTGSLSGATEFYLSSMTQLAKAGIRPSQEAFDQMLGPLDRLRVLSGMTTEEFVRLNDRLSTNVGVRSKLLALEEEERVNYRSGLLNQIASFKALGMLEENAIKASERLQEMAGEDALSRFEKAAQLQAMAGALGVEGASELGSLIRLGQRRTAEQDEELARILGNVQDITATAGMQDFGTEIMVQQLQKMTGATDEFLDTFTRRDAAARAVDETDAALQPLNKTASDLTNTFMDLGSVIERVGVFLNERPVQPFSRAAQQAAGGDILGTVVTGALGGYLGGKIGAGAGMGGALKGILGGAGRAAGMLRFLTPIGLATGAAGLAGMGAYNVYKQWDNIDGFGEGVKAMFGMDVSEGSRERTAQIQELSTQNAERFVGSVNEMMGPLSNMDHNIATMAANIERLIEINKLQAERMEVSPGELETRLAAIDDASYMLQGQAV